MGLLTSFIMFAAEAAEAHPDVLRALVSGVAAAINTHEQHPTPTSASALAELRAGMAAAASSAVTSLLAKEAPKAAPIVPLNPTQAPVAPSLDALP